MPPAAWVLFCIWLAALVTVIAGWSSERNDRWDPRDARLMRKLEERK